MYHLIGMIAFGSHRAATPPPISARIPLHPFLPRPLGLFRSPVAPPWSLALQICARSSHPPPSTDGLLKFTVNRAPTASRGPSSMARHPL
ncbi:hypothetical protein DFH09DRAFT_1311733 [Mycena vulgaris]|nr:hypothetical protein DFH09DRAFT_1311733 [Mycena vulgaris]